MRAGGGEGSCWRAWGPAGWSDGVAVRLVVLVGVGVRVGGEDEVRLVVEVVVVH